MRRLEEEAAARLATIRCIKTCTKNIREGKPFPRSICYVPEYYKYKIGLLEHSNIKVYESPEGKEIDSLSFTSHSILYVDGDEIYCRSGIYGKLIKVYTIKVDVRYKLIKAVKSLSSINCHQFNPSWNAQVSSKLSVWIEIPKLPNQICT